MNWYKISQSWYTGEVAQTTKDPKILTDILRMDKNDWVSYFASSNPNTPPEILTDILRRGKDDDVSRFAASNPNCPPEALTEVLRRGKDDLISGNAASNPNTPPEILAEVLRRGKGDLVSWFAAQNPNTPLKALVDWMRATGKIGKEDPRKHIIEYDKEEEEIDEDLEKLRKLISNNKSWYKKAQQEEILYHVTFTDKIPKILKEGIKPLQTSNWISKGGKRYGNGEIFSLNNKEDAIRWAAKMDWEFNQQMGSGHISIITFKKSNDWDIDSADPLSQLGNKGNWLKQIGSVKPNDIIQTEPVTIEMIKTITQK